MSKIITSFFLLISAISFSQKDSINQLEEIVLNGSFSQVLNTGYNVEVISDSILKSNNQSLGNLLQDQANLYFKQNGYGMVSSIALRGTNASQTGVFWNGIAINSSLNGQTDFNTLTANSFDEIEIRKGGASVLLGSGAIGGAINLRDKVIFSDKKEGNLQLGLGSYQTYTTMLNGLFSNQHFFVKIGAGGTISENDYPYLNSALSNENGQFKNYNINAVIAYKFNDKNSFSYYNSFINNDRNTSRTLTTNGTARLLNFNSRNLLDWKYLGNSFSSSLKLAYLTEDFTFFFDKNENNFSNGKSVNLISKYDLAFYVNNTIFFNAGIEYKKEQGSGTSISKKEQNTINTYLLFHHQPFSKFNYNLSIRKANSSVFEIPFIYAVDAKYELYKQLVLKSAFSTNYRTPTFNDLYWQPGGNPELKSEKSKSAEIGLNYKANKLEFQLTSYYIKSKDLIQWRPVNGTFWQPQNIQDVNNYGIEFMAIAEKKFNAHLFRLKFQYDYTISEDTSINKQLIYVPFHRSNTILSYQYINWRFNYYLQYTGKVYTTSSNTQAIDAYSLSNIDLNRSFFKDKMQIAFRINNLFDKNYQSVAFRPMPNRNYTLNINLNI